MKQFDTLVTKVPHRDVREATRILSEYGSQGYRVAYATMVGNMELLVMLEKEVETLAQTVAKAEAKKAKAKPKKKEEAEEEAEEVSEE
jgi:hypothetical protein